MSATPKSVVLVDDHPVVLAGIKALIETSKEFIVAASAATAEAGLEMIARLKPHLAVVDLSMPGMSGVELTLQVAQASPATMLIALTVHEEPAYVQQVIKAGGRGYVLKRSAAEELVRALRAVSASGAYIDPAVAARMLGTIGRSQLTSADLSEREEEVMRAAAKGFSNKELALKMTLSVKTIETYKARAMDKLNLRSRADLIRYASAQGWISER